MLHNNESNYHLSLLRVCSIQLLKYIIQVVILNALGSDQFSVLADSPVSDHINHKCGLWDLYLDSEI